MGVGFGAKQFADGGRLAKEYRRPPETVKDKETDSPLDALEGTWPCQYSDFSPVKPISHVWSSERKRIRLCCFKPSSSQ